MKISNPPGCFLLILLMASGCGYTQKAVLPNNIQTIYVDTVKNKIPSRDVYVHVPGLEIDITNAVIRRFHQDGTLRVVERHRADAILEMDLIALEQEGLRFTSLESVEEFRLFIVLDMRLVDASTGQVLWREPHFSGESEYFVSDVRSINREEGAQRVVEDLARNVVDRIAEDW